MKFTGLPAFLFAGCALLSVTVLPAEEGNSVKINLDRLKATYESRNPVQDAVDAFSKSNFSFLSTLTDGECIPGIDEKDQAIQEIIKTVGSLPDKIISDTIVGEDQKMYFEFSRAVESYQRRYNIKLLELLTGRP